VEAPAADVGSEKGLTCGRKKDDDESVRMPEPEPCKEWSDSIESALGDGDGRKAMSEGEGGGAACGATKRDG
jgi:hypothetical protein